jgi:putative ABC transport system substrate-binding protein
MRRREFLGVLGGAVAAWPLTARAQQANRVRRVGILMGLAATDSEAVQRAQAFEASGNELGWNAGRNIRIDYRWAPGDLNVLRSHASELVASAPDVIVVAGTPVLAAVQQETSSIPIVFAGVSDPEGSGVIANIARPGGNITGFANFEPAIGGKWLEMLKDVAPAVSRVAILRNPAGLVRIARTIDTLASTFGMQAMDVGVRNGAEIEQALGALAVHSNVGLIVLPDPITTSLRGQIIDLAAKYRWPAIYPFRIFAIDGGLIEYGIDVSDQFRRAASYVDRILKGAKPGDLPVQAPTKFELVVNLKTAKALGITISPVLLGRADEVIE